jgi:hypothetical protein
MELKVKHDIIKMLIPLIGTFFLIRRILPGLGNITWWDYSKYSMPLTLGLFFYQALCWIAYKIVYMTYFFGYTFIEVFEKW